MLAIKSYKKCLLYINEQKDTDKNKQKVIILKKIIKCYFNANLFEDALETCNKALELDPKNE